MLPFWARWAHALFGAPGERPAEERAALVYTMVLALASVAVGLANTALGIPGPWLIIGAVAAVQCLSTWWSFRTVRIGPNVTAWSIFGAGAWTTAWVFVTMGGSLGQANYMMLAVTPMAFLLARGRTRYAIGVAHFVLQYALFGVEQAFPEAMGDGYTSHQQRLDDAYASFTTVSALVLTILALLSRQYEFRVTELKQERDKVRLLLADLNEADRDSDSTSTFHLAATIRQRLQPGGLVGSYRVVRELGAGGMATVYLARHTTLGTEHAIKVVRSNDAHLHRRLLREGEAQALVRSPHIAAVTDTVVIGNVVGLVMDYQNGGNLQRRLREGRLAISSVDRIGRQLILGLNDAHERGLVHRDLKPANILFHTTPQGEVVRIADFGLVKLVDGSNHQTLTHAGALLGTPAYMSPEQISNPATVDRRADLWSLGCVLYEMLRGERAFVGKTTVNLLHLVSAGDFEPLPDTVPKRMRNAVHACLMRDPAHRANSAKEVFVMWTMKGSIDNVAARRAEP